MMTAVVSFTLIAIAGREATKGVAVIEVVFWRSLMAFGVTYTLFDPRIRL